MSPFRLLWWFRNFVGACLGVVVGIAMVLPLGFVFGLLMPGSRVRILRATAEGLENVGKQFREYAENDEHWQDSPGQFVRDAAAGGFVLGLVALAVFVRGWAWGWWG